MRGGFRRWLFGFGGVLALSCSLSGLARADTTGIAPPAALGDVSVAYPEGAHGDAVVELELIIAEDGTVARSTAKVGEPPFAEAARIAAESFRFSPATRNGIAVRARIAMRVVFQEPAPTPAAPAPHDAARGPLPEAAAATGASAPAPDSAAPAAEASTDVTVVGEQRAEIGSIHIPREEARRVPGAFADPFRVVEVLPGVAPVLSGLPYFYVRGAPPGSVGYFIDGVKVPLLFHVGPGPSVIAPAMVERVDLFPGGYPARFGRYAGAVMAGETSAPSDHLRVEGQARIFDASAMIEQPFAGGRGSVLLGGRYSYTQAILAAVAPDYELGYGDYQARIAYAVSPQDTLSLFGFGAYDLLRNDAEGLTLFDTSFQRLDLRWDRSFRAGRMRLAVTGAHDRVVSAPEDQGAPGAANEKTGIRLRFELEHELAKALRLRTGADFGVDDVGSEHAQIAGGARVYPARTDLAGGAYADFVWRPGRGIEIVPGLRVDLGRSRGEDYVHVDPRLAARTRLAHGLSYLASFGLAHQLPTDTVLMPGRQPNLIELSNQRASQLSQGLEYALPDGMLGRTTVFYQNIGIDTPGAYGQSFGAEQFLRRDFTRKLGGFVSYTLSRAQGTVQNQDVVSTFDRTHVLSAVLGYDLGAGFRIGARTYLASGRLLRVACPTPDCGPGDPRAPRQYVGDFRAPAFFRLDARFEKRFTFDNGIWLTGTIEWFNALLASEVEAAHYTPNGVEFEEQAPLTLPSIGIEFGY